VARGSADATLHLDAYLDGEDGEVEAPPSAGMELVLALEADAVVAQLEGQGLLES